MIRMSEKMFVNDDLEIELTSFIDDKQNVWFKGKDVASILGYSKTRDALLKHVDNEDKQLICWRPRLDSIPLYYPLNWNLRKSSNTG